ncbi:splicing regulator SDE2 [Gasterosteus aculeatus]
MRRVLLANMEVFVSSPSVSFSNSLFPDGSLVRDVLNRFVWQQGASSSADFYVVRNGRLSDLEEAVQPGAVYHLEPRLRGGKGGFGSMLRALGAQIEKTTNREACRDLSGRRLRDVNHEKEMAEWLKKQTEREAEKEQRRLERLQRKLKEPKHQFTDPEYQRQCHDLSERLEDSVMKGLQASCSQKTDDVSPAKRPNCDPSEQPQKKKQKKKNAAEACLWMRVDDMPGSEDEEEEDESLSSPSPSPSSCGSAAVAMPMQEVEREQSTSSSDASSDHQTPRPFEDHGPTQAPRDQTPKPPQDQGSPEAPRDQTPKPSQDQRASPHQDLVLVDLDLAQLESLGLDVLKGELMSRGLKCGGTLKERAQRLFSVRGLTPEQIDPALIAKPTKRK